MSSLIDHHPAPMKWARQRTVRFAVYGTIVFGLLFGVFAVKAQILPAPTWSHPFIAFEKAR